MRTRELSAREDRLLRFLLSNMQPEAAQLLPQLDGARVVIADDEAIWLEIEVRPDAAPVDLPNQPIGMRATVLAPSGEVRGEVFVWVTDGRLSSLQQAFYTDDRATAMPDADSIQIDPDPPMGCG